METQLAPPSVVFTMPPANSPAYAVLDVVGSKATAIAKSSGRPVKPPLTGNHDSPASVLLKTPAPEVPTSRTLGSDGALASSVLSSAKKPPFAGLQLDPALVLTRTPSNVPAQT